MNYRSRRSLLGLPLLHVAVGGEGERARRGVARGWIAVGDISFGILFSLGGVAVGGIAFGGLGVGILSIGGLALGAVALGGGAVGIIAFGGAAIAWHAAFGGAALASHYAEGGWALAAHANDAVSGQFFDQNPIARVAERLISHSRWLLVLLVIPFAVQMCRRGGRKV